MPDELRDAERATGVTGGGLEGNLPRVLLPKNRVKLLLNLLTKLPVDTPKQQAAYLQRLRRLEGFLATLVQRHRNGIENGRTPVAHLVEQWARRSLRRGDVLALSLAAAKSVP